MAKKYNWLWIALGIVIFVVILAIAGVGGFGYYMYRQMEPSKTTGAHTEQEFAEVRARFEGEVPYIDFSSMEAGEGTVHHEQEKSEPAQVKQLRLVAYNPDDKTLVRVTLPMWLLNYARNKPISFSGSGGGVQWDDEKVRLKVTPAEIERHGPGLIINTTSRSGEKVIIWAE
ncbi:MAG: hypothetical protein ACM3NQ_07935 [Bacteroidales bacterium]